jgi:hypothetical protein
LLTDECFQALARGIMHVGQRARPLPARRRNDLVAKQNVPALGSTSKHKFFEERSCYESVLICGVFSDNLSIEKSEGHTLHNLKWMEWET